MKRILVVGGAGYIGSHVCRMIAARGIEPIVFDNLSSGHRHAVKWGPLEVGDIRVQGDIERVLARYKPDAVMHFAACIEVGEGERSPLRFWTNNTGGALNLLNAMATTGVENLVFSSTCAVYGQPEFVPISERQACHPLSVYGRSKRAVEQILSDVANVGGVRCAILRYFNAAGASPDGDIGEEHDPETHLIPNALKAAAGIGPKMKLFGTDYPTRDGTCIRDYVHVLDLADAHLAALDMLKMGERKIVANLGTGDGVSVLEILGAIERITGLTPKYEVCERRPGDAPVLSADTAYAEELLGFNPVRSDIDTIIEDAWRFHRRQWGI
ncbi:UDP-glucose 4-epimerase GalE [Maricaulis sp.]|uniref:UDP-glucose 4-epimerase GalE n=1 Tax=Maricaulis sp. TaxID=1486257 RepID=UPI00263A085C|nr:UDP-glucose 4-epimerase GalE [Maricaulis sp.]